MNLFTDDIKTNTEAQIAVVNWIKALRSGEYAQATGYLRTPEGFCCLGVACDLLSLWRWELYPNAGGGRSCYKFINPEDPDYWAGTSLPKRVQDAYCMINGDGRLDDDKLVSLANMNDEGRTFAEIADVIERELTEALK